MPLDPTIRASGCSSCWRTAAPQLLLTQRAVAASVCRALQLPLIALDVDWEKSQAQAGESGRAGVGCASPITWRM